MTKQEAKVLITEIYTKHELCGGKGCERCDEQGYFYRIEVPNNCKDFIKPTPREWRPFILWKP